MNPLIGQVTRAPETYETLDSICCELRVMVDEGPYERCFEDVVLFLEPSEELRLPEVGEEIEVSDPLAIGWRGRTVLLADPASIRVLG
ncbi:MAG: hypothetical protein EDQ89_02510 [Acidobacteria bacterium]|nr:MAG: hypothetical protein EDQ89_02510 [Acidobacteriota bacterium]GIK77718.1 MAG: hypothetical protein BroJett022_14080 [Actinomycetes bacterium]